jgi:HAD superfamily hydrolase (TIGR01490 family)
MLQSKSYIAFFDLDDTLIRGNSGRLLLKTAYHEKLIGLSDVIKALWLSFLFRFRLRDTEKIIHGMVKWLNGVSENDLNELVKRAFTGTGSKMINEQAKSEIEFHRENNAQLVILSSALYPVCRTVADMLGMDDIICTGLEIKDGKYSGIPSGRLCFGNEKRLRMTDYCEKFNKRTGEAWFYSDSHTDITTLNAAGHPVCVNPDRRLRKAAVKNGWLIYEW